MFPLPSASAVKIIELSSLTFRHPSVIAAPLPAFCGRLIHLIETKGDIMTLVVPDGLFTSFISADFAFKIFATR